MALLRWVSENPILATVLLLIVLVFTHDIVAVIVNGLIERRKK